MKITIDEGFFGFFFDLEAKKKRPAGKAIDKYHYFFYINAPLGSLFLLIEKLTKKIKPDAILRTYISNTYNLPSHLVRTHTCDSLRFVSVYLLYL